MFDYIRGKLAEKEVAQVTVEAHGVGYEIAVPFSTFERLPQEGDEVRLHTHFHVREDAQKLFGFLTKGEREIFRLLIGVSSIGPKTAIGVLSKIPVEDLVKSVEYGDASALIKVPGIGGKTAERLVLELRGKLQLAPSELPPVKGGIRGVARPSSAGPASGAVSREAFEALVALGYAEKQVSRAIDRVRETVAGAEQTVEEWIKKALQVI